MSRSSLQAALHIDDEQARPRNTLLTGRKLRVARLLWSSVAIVSLGLFVLGISQYYSYMLHLLCVAGPCTNAAQIGDYVQQLKAMGISAEVYAWYNVLLNFAFTFVYFLVGVILFWRKSNDRMALLASLFLITFSLTFTNTSAALPLAVQVLAQCISFLGSICIALFFYVFPDGRFVPRWTRWLMPGVVLYWGLRTFLSASPLNPLLRFSMLDVLLFVGFVASMIGSQVYRYRRVSNLIQRQQTKWVVFGTSIAVGGYVFLNVGVVVLVSIFSRYSIVRSPLLTLLIGTSAYLLMLLIPLSIGFAILRARLFEIDSIIQRTVVYGTLTASILCLYVLVVSGLGLLFQVQGNFLISLLATGLVAVLFQPLRLWLQRSVNRLLYGERDDPYTVLARLGERLEVTLAPEAVLPTIVETVSLALKLPYVAITIKQDDTFAIAASSGRLATGVTPTHVPLMYQAEQIGELVLAPRGADEQFRAVDQRLLRDLANEIGIAVHAMQLTRATAQLTAALQQSRERLVLAREEERRRLRRDLHDDLGPTLAALALTATTVSELIASDPVTAKALACELQTEIRTTVGNVRRLVYELRPPTLDELGLVAALQERAAQSSSTARSSTSNSDTSLQIVVRAPNTLPQLSAAVEVAAYHIVQEALTNITRHAQARNCSIVISYDNTSLQIEVVDDGIGLPAERRRGVGLHTMRERAEELGGTCVIERRSEGGTRVCACLPLAQELHAPSVETKQE